MYKYRNIAIFIVLGCFLAGAFPAVAAKSKVKKTAQDYLLEGIDHYESGQMEDSMESFMEVLRMGAPLEESELANEYLKRIALRLGGQPVHGDQLMKKPVAGSDDAKQAASREDPKEAPPTEVPPEAAQKLKEQAAEAAALAERQKQAGLKAAQEQSGDATAVSEAEDDDGAAGPSPTRDAIREYIERKFALGRARIIKSLKRFAHLSMALRGQDKIKIMLVPEELIFANETAYRKDSDALLDDLVELIYHHPRHLVRIYPGQSQSKPAIINLQRATVLGAYFGNKGLAPERLEVDLQGAPELVLERGQRRKNLDRLYEDREGRILFVFEEFARPIELHHFFTRYLPKMSAGRDFPSLSLGVSRQRIDARIGEGMVIELFVNANPVDVAHWSLELKDKAGLVVLSKDGKSTALESIYFEGRRGPGENFEILPSGKYKLTADALNVAGGKIELMKEIEIIGSVVPVAPKKLAENKPASPVATQAAKAEKDLLTLKKPAPPAVKLTDNKGPAGRALPAKKKTAVSKAPAVKPPDTGPAKAQELKSEAQMSPDKVPGSDLAGQVQTYIVSFYLNQSGVSGSQLDTLKKVGDAAKFYPLQRFSLLGLAGPDEKEPSSLAKNRVNKVAEVLTSRYGVASSRINIDYGIGEKEQRQVEIFIEE